MRYRAVGGVLVATAVLGVAGCTGGDPEERPSSPATGGTTAGATPGGTVTAGPSATSLTPIAASRNVADREGHELTVTPVTLRREGKLALLELTVTNNDAEDAANVADVLRGSGNRFDEVTLVDKVNAKRYLVALDDQQGCLCSSFIGGLTVDSGRTAVVSAYFSAPPATVTKVDVSVPGGVGVFPDVPISG